MGTHGWFLPLFGQDLGTELLIPILWVCSQLSQGADRGVRVAILGEQLAYLMEPPLETALRGSPAPSSPPLYVSSGAFAQERSLLHRPITSWLQTALS